MLAKEFIEYLEDNLRLIKERELENIKQAADLISESILSGGKLYAFGSGHSHMMVEEIYIRAGSLALVNPILPPELMLHEMANKSTFIERLEGYAEGLLNLYKLEKNDSILLISNSGRNNVVVEMAQKAREIGANVIVINSNKHTMDQPPRHKSGKRMRDFAHVVIDNHAPIGDAGFYIEGIHSPLGPLSNFAGIAIVNTLTVLIVDNLKKAGFEAPIFKSSNVDDADEYNNELFAKYYGYKK